MTDDERTLLNNVLDALDRLVDRKSGVVDIYALTFATARAIPNSHVAILLEKSAHELWTICRFSSLQEEQHGAALAATNELRLHLADIL